MTKLVAGNKYANFIDRPNILGMMDEYTGNGCAERFMLGLHDPDNNGHYVWADGSAVDYTGWDPEVDTKGYESNSSGGQTANAGAGMDFNSYPGMQSFTFGLNLNF